MVQQKKENRVYDFTEIFKNDSIFYLINFSSIPVPQIVILRQKIKEEKGNCKMTKKTLVSLALKKSGQEEILPYLKDLTGAIGFVFGKEANAQKLAGILIKFEKEYEPFSVKVGYFGGKLLTPEGIRSLSVLPSPKIILADLIGSLKFPLVEFLNLLQAPIRNFVNVLKNIEKKKEK